MADKFFRKAKDSEWGDGVLLDGYNGTWSIVAAKEKNYQGEDKIFLEWIYPQKRDGSREAMDKSLPWKVTIGKSKEEAVKTLKYFIKLLSEGDDDF